MAHEIPEVTRKKPKGDDISGNQWNGSALTQAHARVLEILMLSGPRQNDFLIYSYQYYTTLNR